MTLPDMSPTEARVSQMWGRIIGVQPASADDDFFDLGGYSIHLVEFLKEVLSEFQVELDLVDLFVAGFTVAESARAIDQARSAAGSISPGRST
jgi:hypothetical protein